MCWLGHLHVTDTVTRLAIVVITLLLGAPLTCGAQPTGKVYRIGFILTSGPDEAPYARKALAEGLRDLGYVEGRNLVFEERFANGKQERLPGLAAELVRLNVDVIVTGSNPVIAAVKHATTRIPVVMAVSRDPVGAGFLASLARPGGNITGLSNDPGPAIYGKNLELLKEAIPRIGRVAHLWNPDPPAAESYRKAAEDAAWKLGVTLQLLEVRRRDELEGAFGTMLHKRADAVLVVQDPIFLSARSQVVRLAARHRLPAMYGNREYAEVGGLMSYGPNVAHQFRRAATYVDKILKGAKPADLPIEQPTKFELVVNLKAAKALGLTIPSSLLARADQVLE
jgi:putative ABC transport system substrate-binding protein